MTDFTNMTPAEIDTLRVRLSAPVLDQIADSFRSIGWAKDDVVDMVKRNKEAGRASDVRDIQRGKSLDDAREQLAELETKHAMLVAELLQIEAPFEAEFLARGGWTRAYLVTNQNGHIHSSTNCSTCYDTTTYYWVTELSGHDTDEIADLAGEKACTVCYPNAPVNKPTSIFSPEQKAKAAAKAEREAKRAEKAAKAAANAITQPDGQPLRERNGHGSIIKTLTTAKQELNRAVESAYSMDRYSERPTADADQLAHWAKMKVERLAEADYLADAISAKTGIDREELLAKSLKKAEKEWARSYKLAAERGLV